MLITIPPMPTAKIAALLDLIGTAEIYFVELKVCLTSSYLEKRFVTPGISISSDSGYVRGLHSMNEIRELFLIKEYQLLKLKVCVKGDEDLRIKVDFVEHTVEQRGRGLHSRLLSADKLHAEGLLGGDGITTYIESYD
jgi:hypothetical protein